uniref:hypothetical protein n=1 Tax=Vibrio fluvialis TaxID=676 RepID=UPI00155DCDB1|nr:hypothetical protein [Vibrio fluvialis]
MNSTPKAIPPNPGMLSLTTNENRRKPIMPVKITRIKHNSLFLHRFFYPPYHQRFVSLSLALDHAAQKRLAFKMHITGPG